MIEFILGLEAPKNNEYSLKWANKYRFGLIKFINRQMDMGGVFILRHK